MKHNLQNICIKAISYNIVTLILYSTFVKKLLNKSKIFYSLFFLPRKKKRFTLLKSPHAHKKAREQFELVKYSFLLKINNLEMLPLFKINLPKTIKLAVTTKK